MQLSCRLCVHLLFVHTVDVEIFIANTHSVQSTLHYIYNTILRIIYVIILSDHPPQSPSR